MPGDNSNSTDSFVAAVRKAMLHRPAKRRDTKKKFDAVARKKARKVAKASRNRNRR